MTARERIRAGFLGQTPDRVPLHCRMRMAPLDQASQWIRDLGWGVVSSHPGWRLKLSGCTETWREESIAGHRARRRTITTPAGVLTSLEANYYHGGTITLEHLFKNAADYPALLAYVEALIYEPAYAAFIKESERLGDDGYCFSWTGYDPMHEIMMRFMGIEMFAYEWLEHQTKVLEIYEALCNAHRRMYQVVAAGPAEVVTYGGNIQPNVVGRDRFARYYKPCYQDFASVLHSRGKRLGAHLDDKTRHLADLIAECGWDIFEAFAVAPDGDVSLREAQELWPQAVISLNFPSALHHASEAQIRQAVKEYLTDAATPQNLLISLTEDFPENVASRLFTSIAEAVHTFNQS